MKLSGEGPAPLLGPLTESLIEQLCPPALKPRFRKALGTRCSFNLPGVSNTPEWIALIDRVQLAAIRCSGWDYPKLDRAIALARTDWRDVLMGARFGHSTIEHERWHAQALMQGSID